MGKPRSNFKAKRDVKNKSNPFVVKKSTRKTKKKTKPSLEVIDKTFSDLESRCRASSSSLSGSAAKKRINAKATSKLKATLGELVKETAQARIS